MCVCVPSSTTQLSLVRPYWRNCITTVCNGLHGALYSTMMGFPYEQQILRGKIVWNQERASYHTRIDSTYFNLNFRVLKTLGMMARNHDLPNRPWNPYFSGFELLHSLIKVFSCPYTVVETVYNEHANNEFNTYNEHTFCSPHVKIMLCAMRITN